jgi:hypothetical protein
MIELDGLSGGANNRALAAGYTPGEHTAARTTPSTAFSPDPDYDESPYEEESFEPGFEAEFAHHLDSRQDPRSDSPRFNNSRSPFPPYQRSRLPTIQEPPDEPFGEPVQTIPPRGQLPPTASGTVPTDGTTSCEPVPVILQRGQVPATNSGTRPMETAPRVPRPVPPRNGVSTNPNGLRHPVNQGTPNSPANALDHGRPNQRAAVNPHVARRQTQRAQWEEQERACLAQIACERGGYALQPRHGNNRRQSESYLPPPNQPSHEQLHHPRGQQLRQPPHEQLYPRGHQLGLGQPPHEQLYNYRGQQLGQPPHEQPYNPRGQQVGQPPHEQPYNPRGQQVGQPPHEQLHNPRGQQLGLGQPPHEQLYNPRGQHFVLGQPSQYMYGTHEQFRRPSPARKSTQLQALPQTRGNSCYTTFQHHFSSASASSQGYSKGVRAVEVLITPDDHESTEAGEGEPEEGASTFDPNSGPDSLLTSRLEPRQSNGTGIADDPAACADTNGSPTAAATTLTRSTDLLNSSDPDAHRLLGFDPDDDIDCDAGDDDPDPTAGPAPTIIRAVSVPPLELSTTSEMPRSPPDEFHPGTRALNALGVLFSEQKVSVKAFYANLRATALVLHATEGLRGYMDSGAMATTTDRLDFLHAYKSVVSLDVIFRVPDNTKHRPIGVGYLKVRLGFMHDVLLEAGSNHASRVPSRSTDSRLCGLSTASARPPDFDVGALHSQLCCLSAASARPPDPDVGALYSQLCGLLPAAQRAVRGVTLTRFRDGFQGSDIVSFDNFSLPLDAPLSQLSDVSLSPLIGLFDPDHANDHPTHYLMPDRVASDDFNVAAKNPKTSEKLIALIHSFVTTESKGIAPCYNGVDVLQTRDYIKLFCETYVDRVLLTHGWAAPGTNESDRRDRVPISPAPITSLVLLQGPAETTPVHKQLENDVGFSYRQVLGDLIYAYVIFHVDNGYAVTFLARFSQAPVREHYYALKNVVRYLRRTKDWGLMYWRPAPLDSLPCVPFSFPSVDAQLPPFPDISPTELTGFVDAAHATDLTTRRSVSGLVFCYAGGAIAYKTKLQATVATSSTEAEFLAAVHAAKIAKYLRSVLTELGFPPSGPTTLYEDNEAAIAMINENRPTPRVRHVDIQHFAIQEWRARGLVRMEYIPTTLNVADGSTKALGWTLHARHARRAMGHYGRPS